MSIKAVVDLHALRNSIIELGINTTTLKKVDQLFDILLEKYGEYLDDLMDELKGDTFLTFLLGRRINQYIVIVAYVEDGDVMLSCYSTTQYKKVELRLSRMRITEFRDDIDSEFLLFIDNPELYILRKPKLGDQVTEIGDINRHYIIHSMEKENGYATVYNLANTRSKEIDLNRLIVLNKEPLKMVYEITETLPGREPKVEQCFTLPAASLPMIEGATRTIKVVKVK